MTGALQKCPTGGSLALAPPLERRARPAHSALGRIRTVGRDGSALEPDLVGLAVAIDGELSAPNTRIRTTVPFNVSGRCVVGVATLARWFIAREKSLIRSGPQYEIAEEYRWATHSTVGHNPILTGSWALSGIQSRRRTNRQSE
jgi:hypothetical protein